MRLYFNTSALNRPLDDLASERVRIEAETKILRHLRDKGRDVRAGPRAAGPPGDAAAA